MDSSGENFQDHKGQVYYNRDKLVYIVHEY